MRYRELLERADLSAKIKRDPRTLKMLNIAVRQDHSLPPSFIAAIGPKPDPAVVADKWSQLINHALSNSSYGDLAADGKFDDWLLKMYISNAADFEDIHGEAVDVLGAWKALSIRRLLKPQHQDFNRFSTIEQLQRIMRSTEYRQELSRLKDEARLEQMKRDAVMLPILDTERYSVVIPLNYGACYTRDKAAGYTPNFCTSSSSGAHWFQNYAPSGPIINIQDKANTKDEWGKWQMHTATGQLVNADQARRHDRDWNDGQFAERFPGLMSQIINALTTHAAEIQKASRELARPDGYDVSKEIERIKRYYPQSVASTPESARRQAAQA